MIEFKLLAPIEYAYAVWLKKKTNKKKQYSVLTRQTQTLKIKDLKHSIWIDNLRFLTRLRRTHR